MPITSTVKECTSSATSTKPCGGIVVVEFEGIVGREQRRCLKCGTVYK